MDALASRGAAGKRPPCPGVSHPEGGCGQAGVKARDQGRADGQEAASAQSLAFDRVQKAASCQGQSCDDGGQMAVELAVLMPVVLVLALTAANLMAYMGDCARFDRLSAEAVRVLGVSPGYGGYGAESCERSIAEQLNGAFAASDHITIEVTSEEISLLDLDGSGDDGVLELPLIPSYREYTCTMTFDPPFAPDGFFGVSIPSVTHSCSFVVDPFESGGFI